MAGPAADEGPAPDGPDDRAVEYVVGTLPHGEREAFEAELAADAGLRGLVAAWERALLPLALAAGEVAPDPRLWGSIAAAMTGMTETVLAPTIDRLRRSVGRWRVAALAAGALAACLAVFIALDRGQFLPRAEPGRFVAVVNRGGDLPALIARVDTRSGTIRIRPVGAEAPAGRSLQLWYVGQGQAPRSLGLVAPERTDARALPPGVTGLEQGTLAISVEPPGGAPGQAPTGPVIYSGRLLRDEP